MMVHPLARGRPSLILALTLLPLAASRGQEPAPSAPPATTSPEALLRSHDLKRSGSTWILASETSVLKDLRDARDLYRQVEQGMMRRQDLEMGLQEGKNVLEQVRYQTTELRAQIDAIDRELSQLEGAEGNVFAQLQRTELGRQRSALTSEYNRLVTHLNRLELQAREQSGNQDPRLQLNAEVAERREKYMQALLDLRASVDRVKAQYDELARNPDVTKALEALSQSTKLRHKLGPSKALTDAIRILERSEGGIQSESIPLLRESGVFHVMATLGKSPTKMVFDTGAGLTTVSTSLARKIGVKPVPGDSKVQLRTADGTVVEGRLGLIPAVRVGKFTVSNVECAVMPAEKGEVDPLLGQSFLKNFKVEFSPDAGKLTLKRIETGVSESAGIEPPPDQPDPKAATKGRRPARQPRPSPRTKRAPGGRTSSPAGKPAEGLGDAPDSN